MSEQQPDRAEEVWGAAAAELRLALPTSTYDLWIEPLRVVSASADTLYLTAPETARLWVQRRYLPLLLAALKPVDSALVSVEILPESESRSASAASPVEPAISRGLPIDPAHTFDRFVIGPGNRFAHSAALAVAELPGEAYNPLFLHGPPGLGKTHLMGAIAGYMREHNPQINALYTTAERFTSEFVSALRSDGPEAFKRRYRELDALLIDDVQILEGKARTEEEFVHTFNTLHAAGKQVVLSSDRPPESLARLEERVRDRFQWGLTVAIEPPDLRTRINLLWRLAADAGSDNLPEPDALREIAGRVSGNVRLLEGALTRVLALGSVFSEPIDRSLVNRALDPSQAAPKKAAAKAIMAPSVAAIQESVGSVLGVEISAMCSASRIPRVARARQLAMYLAREMTPLSLTQIAREFDRDHSTVIHSVRAVEGRLEPGSDTAEAIHNVRRSLGGYVGGSHKGDDPLHPGPSSQQD